jgi:TP901 family phage tail tape measure protein
MIGLGSSSLGIGIAVHLRNQFSGPSRDVNRSMHGLSANANKMMRSNLTAVRNLSVGMAGAGYILTRSLFKAVGRSMDFNKQLKFIQTISEASGNDITKLKDNVLDLSDAYGFAAKDITTAAKDIIKGGASLSATKLALKPVANMAIIADMPMANSAEMLINVMSNFQLGADKFKHASNVMALAANSSTVDIKDLFEAVKYAGPELKNLNIPLAESMALLATAGQAGLKGSIGGTSVGNMLRYLAKAGSELTGTKKQRKALAAIGMGPEDIVDSNGNLKDLLGLLDTIKAKTAGLGTAQKVSILEAIFGVRGVRGIMPLLNMLDNAKMGKSLKALSKELANVKDNYGDVMAGKINDNLAGDVSKLTESWKNLQLSITGDKEGFFRVFVKGLTKVVNLTRKFSETGFGKFIFGTAMILGPVMLAMGGLGLALSTIGLGLTTTTASFAGMATAAKWAFMKMIGYAGAYNTVSGMGGAGVSLNKGLGRYTATSRGGKMISGALGKRYMSRFGASGLTGILPRLTGMFSSMVPMLGRLLSGFVRFIPIIGVIVTIGSLLFDFKDMVSGVLTVLGELILGIKYFIDLMTPGVNAGLNHKTSRNKMYQKLWGTTPEEEKLYKDSFNKTAYQPNMDQGMRDKMSSNMSRYKAHVVTNVHIDGQRIQQSLSEVEVRELLSGTPIK